jgi:hypothetical protein
MVKQNGMPPPTVNHFSDNRSRSSRCSSFDTVWAEPTLRYASKLKVHRRGFRPRLTAYLGVSRFCSISSFAFFVVADPTETTRRRDK